LDEIARRKGEFKIADCRLRILISWLCLNCPKFAFLNSKFEIVVNIVDFVQYQREETEDACSAIHCRKV
jgi:hypothetical protein